MGPMKQTRKWNYTDKEKQFAQKALHRDEETTNLLQKTDAKRNWYKNVHSQKFGKHKRKHLRRIISEYQKSTEIACKKKHKKQKTTEWKGKKK